MKNFTTIEKTVKVAQCNNCKEQGIMHVKLNDGVAMICTKCHAFEFISDAEFKEVFVNASKPA